MASAEWTKINKKHGGRIPQSRPEAAARQPRAQRPALGGRTALRQATGRCLRPASQLAARPYGLLAARQRPALAGRWSQGLAACKLAGRERGWPQGWPLAASWPFGHFLLPFWLFLSKIFFLKILKNPSFFHGTSIAPHSAVLSSGQN